MWRERAPDPPVADLRYEMAYHEALRSISQQQQALNELRARTGILVAVATVSTSFLGAEAFTGERLPGSWAWLGGGSVRGCVWVRHVRPLATPELAIWMLREHAHQRLD